MWIILVLFWICTLGVSFLIGVRVIQRQFELEKIRLINDARINDDLDDYERTKIKEHRMIKAGARFCIQCGRVSGLYYKSADEDKKPKGITLKRVGVTKG